MMALINTTPPAPPPIRDLLVEKTGEVTRIWAIWFTAMRDAIAASYDTGLFAFWKMDNPVADGVRKDWLGTYNLTDTASAGGVISVAAGKIGQATDYNPAGAGTAFSNTGALLMPTSFSVVGWFYTRATSDQYIFSYDTNTVAGTVTIHLSPAVFDGLRFFTDISTPATTTVALTLNAWHFFVAWHDAVSGLNFVQVDNGAIASAAGPDPVGGPPQLRIARHSGGGGQFDGLIDALGIYPWALSEAERTALWNSGKGFEPW